MNQTFLNKYLIIGMRAETSIDDRGSMAHNTLDQREMEPVIESSDSARDGVHEIPVAVIGDALWPRAEKARRLEGFVEGARLLLLPSTRRVLLLRLFFPFTAVAYVTSGPHRSVPKDSPFSRRLGIDESPRNRRTNRFHPPFKSGTFVT